MGRPQRPRMRVDDMIRDQYNTGRTRGNDYYNRVTDRYPQATQRADSLYDEIRANASAAGGRNYDPNDFESYGIFRGMTGPQGGIDPSRIGSIDENIAGFKEIGRTGGWSDADVARTRLQASRVPTSIFAGLRRGMNQNRALTGGYAPGGGANLGRQEARAAAEGVLDSEINTAESIRSGKLQGLAGAQGAEMGLLDLITGMQKFGASGMQGGEGMALDATQREKLAGTQALQSLYNSSPGELDSLFGNELAGRALDNSSGQGLIGQQGAEDTRRWDRKGRVANTAASGAATAATAGGPGGALNKPRVPNLPMGPANSYYAMTPGA